MVNSEKFGKRLQKIMDEYDLNATNFADQIDVGRSSISHILSGRNKPSLEFVMKVVETFPEVELYWLLNGKGSFPKQATPPVQSPIDQKKEQTLFDAPQETESSSRATYPPAQKPEQAPPVRPERNGKEIDRIIICYADGSFENYNPR